MREAIFYLQLLCQWITGFTVILLVHATKLAAENLCLTSSCVYWCSFDRETDCENYESLHFCFLSQWVGEINPIQGELQLYFSLRLPHPHLRELPLELRRNPSTRHQYEAELTENGGRI